MSNLFVAVGNSATSGIANIGYSTDGETWNLASNSNGNLNTSTGLFNGVNGVNGRSVTYGNGRFVAVGKSNTGGTANIGYSTDGQNWFLASNANTNLNPTTGLFNGGNGNSLTYGNGVFVAVGYSGTGGTANIGYSTDGENWFLASNANNNLNPTTGLFNGGGVNNSGNGVAYGNGVFVAVGQSGTFGTANIGYSLDGQNWFLASNANTNLDPTTGLFNGGGGLGITFGNGIFVAVGESGTGGTTNIGYSADGQNWFLASNANNNLDPTTGYLIQVLDEMSLMGMAILWQWA